MQQNKIPAENVSLVTRTMFFIFSQRLEKHIHFLAKYALAPGSSAYWSFFPSVGSIVMDAVYGAAMTSVKGRHGERCIARLSAQCLNML